MEGIDVPDLLNKPRQYQAHAAYQLVNDIINNVEQVGTFVVTLPEMRATLIKGWASWRQFTEPVRFVFLPKHLGKNINPKSEKWLDENYPRIKNAQFKYSRANWRFNIDGITITKYAAAGDIFKKNNLSVNAIMFHDPHNSWDKIMIVDVTRPTRTYSNKSGPIGNSIVNNFSITPPEDECHYMLQSMASSVANLDGIPSIIGSEPLDRISPDMTYDEISLDVINSDQTVLPNQCAGSGLNEYLDMDFFSGSMISHKATLVSNNNHSEYIQEKASTPTMNETEPSGNMQDYSSEANQSPLSGDGPSTSLQSLYFRDCAPIPEPEELQVKLRDFSSMPTFPLSSYVTCNQSPTLNDKGVSTETLVIDVDMGNNNKRKKREQALTNHRQTVKALDWEINTLTSGLTPVKVKTADGMDPYVLQSDGSNEAEQLLKQLKLNNACINGLAGPIDASGLNTGQVIPLIIGALKDFKEQQVDMDTRLSEGAYMLDVLQKDMENLKLKGAPQDQSVTSYPPKIPTICKVNTPISADSTTAIEDAIANFLRCYKQPATAIQIAKGIGLVKKKEVNSHLDKMRRRNRLMKIENDASARPLWALFGSDLHPQVSSIVK